jgi:glucosamine--fructose-6-phosphate aminotransferase (isomerizing)
MPRGHVFATKTDSEAVAHLVADEMRSGATPEKTVS